MSKGCYPYYISMPVKGIHHYYQTEVAHLPAFQNQLIPNPENPGGFEFYYEIDPKTGRPEINSITGKPIPRAITEKDCIDKLQKKNFNIPESKEVTKKIKIEYSSFLENQNNKISDRVISIALVKTNWDYIGRNENYKNNFNKILINYDYFAKLKEGILPTIIHEFGHALGLNHPHCDEKKASTKPSDFKPMTTLIKLSPRIIEQFHLLIHQALDMFEFYLNIKFDRERLNETYNKVMKEALQPQSQHIQTLPPKSSVVMQKDGNEDRPQPSKNIGRSQTWGDHKNYTVMSYVGPRYPALMKHDILALQGLWGRKNPATVSGLSLWVNATPETTGSFLIHQNGMPDPATAFGPKVYDDANIKVLDCSTSTVPLLIDDTGVYSRSDDSIRDCHPKAVFTQYTKPTFIVDGEKADRINLGSYTGNNIILSLAGDDIISGGQGNETILFGNCHGNVKIHDSRGFLTLVFPCSEGELEFNRVGDHLLIKNPYYAFPYQDYSINQKEGSWVIKNLKSQKTLNFLAKDYFYYSSKGRHILKPKTPKTRIITVVNGYRWIGRIAVYTRSGLSVNQQSLWSNLETRKHNLQNFNPAELTTPFYGHDVKGGAFIIRGYWRRITFDLINRNNPQDTKYRKTRKFIIADRHISKLEASFTRGANFLGTTLVMETKEKYPNLLEILNVQEDKDKKLQIVDRNGNSLTLSYPDTRLPHRRR